MLHSCRLRCFAQFFFFKQKTAYEMRISDWSSDVCSSDLIAVVGSTGAGKSHTIAKIVQSAVSAKDGEYALNNSHIVIFDIHSEYKSAFPNANFLDASNLTLPYWLLNSEELEEVLLDTGEREIGRAHV